MAFAVAADSVDGVSSVRAGVVDPRVPRKLSLQFAHRGKGVGPVAPVGLRVVGRWLYMCDSNDDDVLQTRGHCSLVGLSRHFDSYSLKRLPSHTRVVPMRRWDASHETWTAEESAYGVIPEVRVPKHADLSFDAGGVPAMPPSMTEPNVAELPDCIEGTLHIGVMPPLPVSVLPDVSLARHPDLARLARWEEFLTVHAHDFEKLTQHRHTHFRAREGYIFPQYPDKTPSPRPHTMTSNHALQQVTRLWT